MAGGPQDVQAILADLEAQPPGPALIVGDFNADMSSLASMSGALERGVLLDVGYHANRWGQPAAEPTCRAPGAAQPTRRDYVIANPDAFRLIAGFSLDNQSELDVHSILQLKLHIPDPMVTITTIRRPKPLTDLIRAQLRQRRREGEDEPRKTNLRQLPSASLYQGKQLSHEI